MQKLYVKWWKTEGKSAHCDTSSLNEETSALSISKIAGVFLTVFAILILSTFVSIIEFINKVKKISKDKVIA